jgi:hypothetical protein
MEFSIKESARKWPSFPIWVDVGGGWTQVGVGISLVSF